MPPLWMSFQVFVWRGGQIVPDKVFYTKSSNASKYASALHEPAWVILRETGKVMARNKVKVKIGNES